MSESEREDIGMAFVTAFVMVAAGPGGWAAIGSGAFWTQVAVLTGASYGLNELGESMAPKPPNFQAERARADVTTVSPIDPHKLIYGRSLTGGTLVYSNISSQSSNYLNMVIALAPHQIEGIEQIYVNSDVAVDLQVPGTVMSITEQAENDLFGLNELKTITGSVAPGGQVNVIGNCGISSAHGTISLSVAGGTVGLNALNIVDMTYQNTTTSAQTYTLTMYGNNTTPSQINLVLWNCNFQVAEKYKDYIKFYPVYAASNDYLEALGRDVTNGDLPWKQTDGEWDTSHTMSGISHIWIRVSLQGAEEIWKGTPPNIACAIKGKPLFDPRTSTTAWSSNPALVIRDYLLSDVYGCDVETSEIDDATFIAAANLSDETLDLNSVTGTVKEDPDSAGKTLWTINAGANEFDYLPFHIGDTIKVNGLSYGHGLWNNFVKVLSFTEDKHGCYLDYVWQASDYTDTTTYIDYELDRYSCNGLTDTVKSKKTNLDQMLTTCVGRLTYSTGKFGLLAGEYRSPEYTITQDDLVGPIRIATRPGRRSLFNGIKGFYSSRNEDYVAQDFVPYLDSAAVTADGGSENYIDLPLPYTTNPKQAEELAAIALRRSRLFETVAIQCNLTALRYQVGDTVQLTYPRASITNKVYEIIGYNLNFTDVMTVDLVLQEMSSSVYPN